MIVTFYVRNETPGSEESPVLVKVRRGFTLIELLVVIAIIAILIALFASGGTASERGRTADAVQE